jgi:hypothetical protein
MVTFSKLICNVKVGKQNTGTQSWCVIFILPHLKNMLSVKKEVLHCHFYYCPFMYSGWCCNGSGNGNLKLAITGNFSFSLTFLLSAHNIVNNKKNSNTKHQLKRNSFLLWKCLFLFLLCHFYLVIFMWVMPVIFGDCSVFSTISV